MYEHDISASNPTTSGATNLYEGTFFFSTTENKVYKVLDNNGGTAYSGAEPTTTSTTFHLNLVDILFSICTHLLLHKFKSFLRQTLRSSKNNRLNCICCCS